MKPEYQERIDKLLEAKRRNVEKLLKHAGASKSVFSSQHITNYGMAIHKVNVELSLWESFEYKPEDTLAKANILLLSEGITFEITDIDTKMLVEGTKEWLKCV